MSTIIPAPLLALEMANNRKRFADDFDAPLPDKAV
jgi:hypothetical protein